MVPPFHLLGLTSAAWGVHSLILSPEGTRLEKEKYRPIQVQLIGVTALLF